MSDSPQDSERNGHITTEEIALYDRQIRLWGLDAQQRMRGSAILLIGCQGLTLETAKNLVLAGVGSLVIAADATVEQMDVEVQFYVGQQDIGKVWSAVVAKKLKVLNPRVEIRTVAESGIDDELLSASSVVACVGQPIDKQTLFNDKCRELGTKFLAADCFGMFGYIFCDFIRHTYIEERKEVPTTNKDEVKTVKETKTQTFVPLRDAFKARFDGMGGRKLRRMLSPLLVGYQALWAFEQEHKRRPAPSVDLDELKRVLDTVCERGAIPRDFVEPELLERICNNARLEYPPANAVMGGMLAQEILKAVTAKESPFTNFFLFDAANNEGTVNYLAPPTP
ncbi:E1 ubiquitin-activating protein aos1 [Spiromyces aspiralis]|uniref:E1 ubiquitin-activating protein aos1 n=1 Tax=Spiromyces aspiralis TaxID=68401 RepID=A0ACC1HU52_9FUNG|nr:E1 ubiquitin-activating protein aos1 [Spiromyces aspiralis]